MFLCNMLFKNSARNQIVCHIWYILPISSSFSFLPEPSPIDMEPSTCKERGEGIRLCDGNISSGIKYRIEDLFVEITCLCRLLVCTYNYFHLILGFNSFLQTMVVTLIWIQEKVICTDNGFNLKYYFTKKVI